MLKKTLALATAALFVAGAAMAAPQDHKAKQKPAPKLTVVKVCPMTGEAVKGDGGGNEVVGKYKVYFCCPSCQPGFDKLSSKQKEQKIAEVLKKQHTKKS